MRYPLDTRSAARGEPPERPPSDGTTSAERMRLVELEKEVRELERANEILHDASVSRSG